MTELAALGARLRELGLDGRRLAAWAGTDRLSALPARVPGLAARPVTPAGVALQLLVAGGSLRVDQLGPLARELDALCRAALVEVDGDRVRARVALLPLRGSLLVCDRLDAPDDRERVCWPDDSSYHLTSALPAHGGARWIDLGCGSAFASLALPRLARELAAVELNPRAAGHARLGAALSGVDWLTIRDGDLAAPMPEAWRAGCELVTCNAPIPDAAIPDAPIPDAPIHGAPIPDAPIPDATRDRPLWRATTPDFVGRLFEAAGGLVAPGGLVVVHAALDALVVIDAPGELAIVAYTPADAARGFAIAWWAPTAAPRRVVAHRPLTAARPHLEHADRLAALAASCRSGNRVTVAGA